MSRRALLRKTLDPGSIWCLRILAAAGVVATGALALARSPRMGWMAMAALMLLLLNGVNQLRIRARIKRVRGTASRPRKRKARSADPF
jgi:hypothetical protein